MRYNYKTVSVKMLSKQDLSLVEFNNMLKFAVGLVYEEGLGWLVGGWGCV